MRKKEERLLITFPSTVQAMKMEQICKAGNHPGRLIPVPREITAGCGLSWSAPPNAKEELEKVMEEHELFFEQKVILWI
ncbi:MAG: DUF3343 domain-containing protein [Lachnospiraceae bacterium]|nr:DUF3343 domain-containing protein [Lachnospiraceae bacterium]